MLKLLKIPAGFLITGICWALFSDAIITFLTHHLSIFQQDVYRTVNNFLFVAIVAVILYFEIRRQEYILSRSEEDYRNLFETNPNPMWIFDKETLKFVNVNEAAIKKYQYSKQKFLRMKVEDIRPVHDKNRFNKFVKTTMTDGIQTSGTWSHILGNGEIINVSITSNNIIFNNRDCKLVMATDVTELMLKESKLQEAYEKIKNRNETLLHVAWSNSHELRKPVCSVLSLASLLRESASEQERKEYLNMLESCSTELDQLLKKNNNEIDNLKIDESA